MLAHCLHHDNASKKSLELASRGLTGPAIRRLWRHRLLPLVTDMALDWSGWCRRHHPVNYHCSIGDLRCFDAHARWLKITGLRWVATTSPSPTPGRKFAASFTWDGRTDRLRIPSSIMMIVITPRIRSVLLGPAR